VRQRRRHRGPDWADCVVMGHDHDGDEDGHRGGGGRSHGHSHGSALARSGAAAKRPLGIALGLGLLTFLVQIVVAVATDSLALLTDSAHVLTDVAGVGLALAAVVVADRPTRPDRTFGLYRLEVLTALLNALLMLVVAVWAVIEGLGRLGDPPDVPGVPVLVVGAFGLVTNLVALRLLSAGQSMVAEGARLDVLADTIGSVGVMIGALVIITTGAEVADTWVGLAIAVWIVPRSIRLAADALRVLVQAAPVGMDLDGVRHDLEELPDVVGVHDLHVWTLTSDMDVLTAHVMVRTDADHHGVLDRARAVLADRHGIHHATLQVEPEDHAGCDELDW
jgi:cobalt-zinc-cadmium efflux system protein